METTPDTVQTKVKELFGLLKNLAKNYELTTLNLKIVLHDKENIPR